MRRIFHIIVRWTRRMGLDHLWPIAAYLTLYMIWFTILEHVERSHYIEVSFALDQHIPLVEAFVVPYLSWFLFIMIGIFYTYFMDRDAFDEMSTILMIGMTAFLVISTFFPNQQGLRPTELTSDGLFADALRRIWSVDTPTNVFPSIHVFNSAAVEYGLLKAHAGTKRNPVFQILTMTWTILIILSTVLIRQHSVLDMISALALIAVSWVLVSKKGMVLRFEGWDAYVDRVMDEVKSRAD
ncbi:MAG: phosphatase PAP2 family protein [Lachnospiraceae bacterium]|nr:phosphatase PAP2 family protein [Lachnospiraceae bacterium]